MSGPRPAGGAKYPSREKARESLADPHRHQGYLPLHQGSFDGRYQDACNNECSYTTSFLQAHPQTQALLGYATHEPLKGLSSGHMGYWNSSDSQHQNAPDEVISSSSNGPFSYSVGHAQQQADPQCNNAPDTSRNDWNLSAQMFDEDLTDFGISCSPARRDEQLHETVFDFDRSYLGFDQNAAAQALAQISKDPDIFSQKSEPGLEMAWVDDLRDVEVAPDSESSLSLTSSESQDRAPHHHNFVQDDGIMSTTCSNGPWSVENQRRTGSDPVDVTLERDLNVHSVEVTTPARSSSAYAPSTDNSSSMFMSDLQLSETTPDNFFADVDMIFSSPTIRGVSTEQQGVGASMSSTDGITPRGPYAENAYQIPEIRFWIRSDTPSRELGAPQIYHTVLFQTYHTLPVPRPVSEISSHSSHLSPIDSHSPLSVTSPSLPDILECSDMNCLVTFSGTYRKGNLRRHQRLKHTGNIGDFACENPSCPRKFKRKDARLKHYRKHHPSLAAAAKPRGRNSVSSDRTSSER